MDGPDLQREGKLRAQKGEAEREATEAREGAELRRDATVELWNAPEREHDLSGPAERIAHLPLTPHVPLVGVSSALEANIGRMTP